MMRGNWIAVATIFLVLATLGACGKPVDDLSAEAGPVVDEGFRGVDGFARFGSQCMLGYNSPIQAEKLEAWDCPVSMDKLELAQDLRPIILTADCKDKILTIRGENRSMDTSWEIMPDNTFFFTIDGGKVQLKNDGSGNSNCTLPSTLDIWGKIDCPTAVVDRDKVNIQFETVYWLGKTPPAPRPSPSPSPSVVTPSPRPSASPAPHPSPTPTPSASPTPHQLITFTIHPRKHGPRSRYLGWFEDRIRHFNLDSPSGTAQCSLPASCYLYAAHTEKQCQ